MKINTYLNFDGNCLEAFEFYRSALGGEFVGGIMKMGDVPDMPLADAEKDRIMHIALQLGNDKIMGSDILPSMGQKIAFGNTNYVVILPETRAEADEIFAKLSEGGKVEMPIGEQFFGYFASFTDKFGIQFMINVPNN